MDFISIALLVSGLVLLIGGGEALVRGSVATGIRVGLSPLAAGLTIVAFGTSSPELIVNLRAASIGEGGLAVGNIVGSNIANIGLIMGLSVLIRPVKLDVRMVRNDVYIMVAATALGVVSLLDGHLSRIEGMVMFAGIVWYIAYNLQRARKARETSREQFAESLTVSEAPLWKSLLLIVVSLLVLSGGGFLAVKGAVSLAEALGASPAVIGLTVVAIGTSLPELATSAVAAYRNHGDMSIGNVVGSNTFNLLFVLGLTACLMPLEIGAVSKIDLAVTVVFSLYFIRLMHVGALMARWEGVVLLAGFVGYMGYLAA
ncbi:MAG TPA: calcium/sodium antiporter [Xanthomonadales bacterium]|nr:calcium/sodium antiporter [Xanthomonadales bacterium]